MKKWNCISKGYYGVSWIFISRLYAHFIDFRWIINDIINSLIKMDHKNLSISWKKIKIFFIFKGGNVNDITRYRPLTILPTVVKLFESCLTESILNDIITRNMISTKYQKAHIKNANGCWERVFLVNHKLNYFKKNKTDHIAFFLDIKNAFGSVNYEKLIFILKKNYYPIQFISYVENYYDNLIVEFKNKNLKWKNGLLQGSCLSNILFLIYIDDTIKEYINLLNAMNIETNEISNNFFGIVDDITILLSKNQDLEKIIKITDIHFKKYGFYFNVNKMFYIEFQNEDVNLKIDNINIKKADVNSKYLGQPLITNENIVDKIIEEITEKLDKIDSLEVQNNVKIHLYNIYLS